MVDSKRIAPIDEGPEKGSSIVCSSSPHELGEMDAAPRVLTAEDATTAEFAIAVDPTFDDRAFAEAIGRMLMTKRRWGILDPRMPTEVRVRLRDQRG